MANIWDQNRRCKDIIRTTINRYKAGEGTDQFWGAIEDIFSIAVHACGQYCTNQHVCERFWFKADSGLLETLSWGDETLFFKLSTYNAISDLAVDLCDLYEDEIKIMYSKDPE